MVPGTQKELTAPAAPLKLENRNGWLICPICRRRKLLRVYRETNGRNIPLYCKNCKTEFVVDIVKGQSFQSQSR